MINPPLDQASAIKLLQDQQFSMVLKDHPLSYYAKDHKEFLSLQREVQGDSSIPWMNRWMDQCKGKPEEEECFWQNLWLNFFTTNLTTTHPKILKIIELLKADGITLYEPRLHLDKILCSLSKEEIHNIRETIKDAIRLNYFERYSFPKFLQDRPDPEILLAYVQKSEYNLSRVPKEMRSEELYFAAIRQNGDYLRDVPLDERTDELCLEAVKQHGESLSYVPEDKQKEELYLEAVKQNGIALQHIPKDKRTNELCLIAVQQNGEAISYVPEDKRTEDLS